MSEQFDVVVVGGGNAALCAALAARERGKKVVVLERAPESARGGNSFFTGGLMRFTYDGLDDMRRAFPELDGAGAEDYILDPYTIEDFYNDMAQVTDYRMDADLVDVFTDKARETIDWMHTKRVRFTWALGTHANLVDGKYRFWGNAPVLVTGGGAGLVDALLAACADAGVEIRYNARAIRLLGAPGGRVEGVELQARPGERHQIRAAGVVLAAGGFQANTEMRARYLGKNWDLAKVRGTEYNTGDGIKMALEFDAQPYGHYSGCHAVAWDAGAGPTGNRALGDSFSRHAYPFSVVVNRLGRRFMDEGADFQTHTYAKYGAEILAQPGQSAFQIFDQQVEKLIRGDYRIREATKLIADTIEELAVKMEVSPAALVASIEEYNAAVQEGEFNPTVLDGKSTVGITPPKSNWALRIDKPPFLAFPVTTGITFTFGGIRIDTDARVLSQDGAPIEGLFAAGEMVGGLYYNNYASGSGLTAGAVYGRRAGYGAAAA